MSGKFNKANFVNKFRADVAEHLARIEKALLHLEKRPDDSAAFDDIEREMHTIKGSAAMMGYKRISDLAHTFEDALTRVRKKEAGLDDARIELLFQTLDSIKILLEDKVTWPDSGIEYPFVADLQKKIEKVFGPAASAAKKEPRRKKEVPPPTPPLLTPALPTGIEHESIRVDVRKLNDLMNTVGELAIRKIQIDQHKTDLAEILSYVEQLHNRLSQIEGKNIPVTLARNTKRIFERRIEELSRTVDGLNLTAAELQDGVMHARMLPLNVLFQALPRFVRDLSKEENKMIDFNVIGEAVELDKTVMEKIGDPIMHILRNAVDHGIELPHERVKDGKSPAGNITLKAYYKNSQVIIEMEDDGRGIDPLKVKDHAVNKGMITNVEAENLSTGQTYDLLFTPGFSTSEKVSKVSGRGVGLDVVKTNIKQLNGMINISSSIGKGAKFTITLPLSLAVTPALLVKSGYETFVITCGNIIETSRITDNDIRKTERHEAISVRDEIIPLVRLAEALKLKEEKPPAGARKGRLPVVIVGLAEKKLAIMVDRLIGKLDVVTKTLGDHLKKVPYISGATILGGGEAVLILDIASLIMDASLLQGVVRPLAVKEEKEDARRSIMIIEDSVITRDLERAILESAGYLVTIAKDGLEAMEILKKRTFDLILADISMPGMSGIELMRILKEDIRLKAIPIVVVSAKETEEDKKIGLAAGAGAYLVKSQFDQTSLLAAIERLIG